MVETVADKPKGKKEKKSNRRGKKKRNGEGKKKGKKMVPLQLFATQGGFKGVETDEVDASVMFSKSVTGAVQMKLSDIPIRSVTGPTFTASYDIHLIVPGYGNLVSSGTLCELLGSTYEIKNPSPYSVTVRLQRPMGFADDCSSLAMWEPLGGELVHEIKPRASKTFGSGNGRTDHMVPREITIDGKRCVHLLSFAVYRENLTDYGTTPAPTEVAKEVGLIVEMVSRYKCMNGEVGQMPGYVVESFSGANRLNHVNVGPLVPTRLCDINVKSGPVRYAELDSSKSTGYMQLLFSADGANFVSECDLDQKTVYRLNTGVVMVNPTNKKLRVANYISCQGGDKEWLIGFLGGTGLTAKFTPGVADAKFDASGAITVDEWIYPLTVNAPKSKVKGRKQRGLMAIQHNSIKMRTPELHRGLDASIITSFIEALVIIYEVTKVAVEILGVVGVLANPELQHVKMIEVDSLV